MSGVINADIVLFARSSVSSMISWERIFSHSQTNSSFAISVPLKNPLKNSKGPLKVRKYLSPGNFSIRPKVKSNELRFS